MRKKATVLGAGIQGVCVALMLEKHGYQVQLIDKNWGIMNRSSLTHEGKIHLGFVYGMDKTRQTGFRMVSDALNFAPYMDYLYGRSIPWGDLKSKKNIYLVIRDSMISSDDVISYFESLNSEFQVQIQDKKLNYLGQRPNRIFNKCPIPWYVERNLIDAAFETEEVSIDQPGFRQLIEKKILDNLDIKTFFEHQIERISRNKTGFIIDCTLTDGSKTQIQSEILINCLWESKVRFDRMIGLPDNVIPSIRLKYGLVVKADDFLRKIDTLTMIHGPYGNFVVSKNSDTAFCSWYPASMMGIMGYGPLPGNWEQACDGITTPEMKEKLGRDNYDGFKKYIPQLNRLEVIKVTAGVILSSGVRDIDKVDSQFHARIEYPVRELDGYYSISTSKFTSAPRNTMLLEEMIFG